ncbi:MAG TPA: methyltransferase [Candidatus Binataceae bacterium]|nr:methyltransferase [Candidatus Binataceae bacterium]
MPSKKSGSGPSPLKTYEDLLAFAWDGLALGAAVELDLFSHIAAGKTSAPQVAAAAGASEHGTRRLLDALCGMGYLKKSGQSYKLQRSAAEHLVRGKPLYMGDAAMIGKMLMGPWSMLAEVVKSGGPVRNPRSAEEPQAFFAKLVPAIFPASFLAATATVKRLPAAARNRIRRILDIGAGAAAWSIPFAKALKRARVTVADYPAVTQVARQYAERFGVADRFDYLEGDFREVDFGTAKFDLAILGHILHGEGLDWSKRLLKRTCDALVDGGMLLIGEFVPNDQRSAPALPLLFGLNMLVNIPGGDVFTMREYREWLKEAGFRKVATLPAPHVSPLILATK